MFLKLHLTNKIQAFTWMTLHYLLMKRLYNHAEVVNKQKKYLTSSLKAQIPRRKIFVCIDSTYKNIYTNLYTVCSHRKGLNLKIS